MLRAALAWVASASSSSGGAKRAAKKRMSQRPLRMARAVERPGEPVVRRDCVGSVAAAERVELIMSSWCPFRINGFSLRSPARERDTTALRRGRCKLLETGFFRLRCFQYDAYVCRSRYWVELVPIEDR